MCGIAGIFNLTSSEPPDGATVRQMLAALRHRGPDQFGMYHDQGAAIGSARLSIVDLAGGQQPISNEDESKWVVFNGEIFNHAELRDELMARGHRFRTRSDTEVLLHLFEEYGADGLHRLNGDFAFAIWDAAANSFFVARDRIGVRPLFYTVSGGRLIFASEIKAILTHPDVAAAIDPDALRQMFTFWSTLPGHTMFQNIHELPPGHVMVSGGDRFSTRPYWQLSFVPGPADERNEDLATTLDGLLDRATAQRLRADVPVGAYLSGGLDSSLLSAIARKHVHRLKTFSIAFEEPGFDESEYQMQVAAQLGTEHQALRVTSQALMDALPEAVWHAETPMMRLAPVPMYLLAQIVRRSGCKVVLTGEGADELFGGYDLFKEAKIREWWAHHPESHLRPRLLRRIYADIGGFSDLPEVMLASFFGKDIHRLSDAAYSHAVRWRNNRRATKYLVSAGEQLAGAFDLPPLPEHFCEWGILERAQYLEATVFLPQYLLSTQGDRMAMAHGVEGRFPFLDEQVIRFATRLPSRQKLHALRDKYLLRKVASKHLPRSISQRAKRPYRAPLDSRLFSALAPEYVRDLLSPEAIRMSGLFEPTAVAHLLAKAARGMPLRHSDETTLIGILSTQILHAQYIEHFSISEPVPIDGALKVCHGPY